MNPSNLPAAMGCAFNLYVSTRIEFAPPGYLFPSHANLKRPKNKTHDYNT